jgi:hypothetical protein
MRLPTLLVGRRRLRRFDGIEKGHPKVAFSTD